MKCLLEVVSRLATQKVYKILSRARGIQMTLTQVCKTFFLNINAYYQLTDIDTSTLSLPPSISSSPSSEYSGK